MSGTNRFEIETKGFGRRTERPASRIAVFGLAVLGALALVVGMEVSTWHRLNLLRADLATVHTEAFQFGLQLRAGVWRLDSRVLRFQLSGEVSERELFLEESRELGVRMERAKLQVLTARERELVAQVEAAFEQYLAEVTPLLERSIRGIRRGTTEQLARTIAEKSAPVLQLADELVALQETGLQSVVGQSQRSLNRLAALMHASAVVLIVFLSFLLVLGYRALIVPLRHRLRENHAVMDRQEKLASLGTLAAGVAHEIRNPLAAIKFHLFSLKSTLQPAQADGEDVQVIGSEINRLERIVKDFLDFARPSEPRIVAVAAGRLLSEVGNLFSAQLEKRSIRVEVQAPDDVQAKVDKEQIKQVLINLIQNAADSIRQDGTITLRARTGAGRLGNRTQTVVILEVSDTGGGIPPEIESRLFDPFFTTREGGSGLGLAIAARIVEKHGGHLQYQRAEGGGAAFSIVLPRKTNDTTANPAGGR